MCSVLSSQGVVLATAMAVSGTVILLALRLQKPPPNSTTHFSIPPSCIITSGEGKKKEKRKKKVQFAEDVVDPIGNGEEYRKKYSNSTTVKKGRKVGEMAGNRVALYSGSLRERVFHKVSYSC